MTRAEFDAQLDMMRGLKVVTKTYLLAKNYILRNLIIV
jgi:hypothetical protein